MPTKWRRVWCRRDDLIWEQLETKSDAWCDSVHKADVQRAVGAFIVKCKPGKGVVLYILEKGGYNVSYRLEYDDGTSVVMRIPIKGVFWCVLRALDLGTRLCQTRADRQISSHPLPTRRCAMKWPR